MTNKSNVIKVSIELWTAKDKPSAFGALNSNNSDESEGVKQIRRNMIAYNFRAKRLANEFEDRNNRTKRDNRLP